MRRCVRFTAMELAWERVTALREARATCLAEYYANPEEFILEYPGPTPVRSCVQQETI
jgi:hypothetical protein